MADSVVLQGALLESGAAPAGGAPAKIWSGAWLMAIRSLRLSLRAIDGLVVALALPVILMGLFVYLFGGAIHTGARYIDYVVPGVLVVCVGYSAVTTSISVAHDLNEGIVDRLRSMDIGGVSFMSGHVLAGAVRNLISTVLVLGVAFAMGFRAHAGALDWLEALALLTLCVLAYTWLTATLGTLARSAEAANGMGFLVGFVAYPSSAFVPVNDMAPWVRGFAHHQPVTPIVNTLRGLLDGARGTDSWVAVAWCFGIIALSVALAGWLFRIRTEN
ncbi:MAG TPA: ABC transporter permease [Acidimicrobiales bacterium]|nr:ABC transporter permease [Acidimicrobiales bacterium]